MKTQKNSKGQIKVNGNTYKLDPQVANSKKGETLITIAGGELKNIEYLDKSGNERELEIFEVTFQYKGVTNSGNLSDQLTFKESFTNNNVLRGGVPTLFGELAINFGAFSMPDLTSELDDEVVEDVEDVEDDTDTDNDGFIAPKVIASKDNEVPGDLDLDYFFNENFYGKSFICSVTRDNTSSSKKGNNGYLSIIPGTIRKFGK